MTPDDADELGHDSFEDFLSEARDKAVRGSPTSVPIRTLISYVGAELAVGGFAHTRSIGSPGPAAVTIRGASRRCRPLLSALSGNR